MRPDAPPRIEIVSVDASHVRLRQGERTAEAHVRSPELEDTALAALAALAELIPAAVAISLEELHVVTGRRDVVVAVLVVRVAGVPLPHVGAALAGDEPHLATVRAVVDGLNRRLAILGG